MSKSFKIYINKGKRKIISLDEPLKILNGCLQMYIKNVNIFWDYNNLDSSYHYNYDIDAANTKVSFSSGYYNFFLLKKEFENTGNIKLEEIPTEGKCKIKSDKKMNLKSIGPILGFSSNKEISANTWVKSESIVNINNDLESVNIYCNLINTSRNFFQWKKKQSTIANSNYF